MPDPADVAAHLKLLQEAYTAQLPERLKSIEAVWQALQDGTYDATAWQALHRMAHSLAGSGATFGFATLSLAALKLESVLQVVLDQAASPSDAQREEIAAALAAVQQAALVPDSAVAQHPLNVLPAQPLVAETSEERHIFLVANSAYLLHDLAPQISHFGYSVQTFAHPNQVMQAIDQAAPLAIIMDCAWLMVRHAGNDVLCKLKQHERPIPLIYVAAEGDPHSQLEAVRAGGAAYFTAPVDISALIDTLDRLTIASSPQPYRILIVDDEALVTAYHMHALQQAGMITAVVNDPLQTMRVLSEFRPDLVLLDVHMPTWSGPELAAVIRQQEAYVSLPIVFLSTETNLDRQLAAMRLGGDNFLTKPIQADHLIAVVSSRVERWRILRSLMVRDSLTGLFNHTTIKKHLDIELARAGRQLDPLAVGMIDIDHFKLVNDTYGHPAGDRVIKSLARLLRQRLRKTDVIGRYGGEEFMVILPNTNAPTAAQVLETIRNGFAQVQYQSEGTVFNVTFSCGVADFPAHTTANDLCAAADQALYAAKRSGRNRVMLDPSAAMPPASPHASSRQPG